MDNREVYCVHGKLLRESCDRCEMAALLSLKLRWKEDLSQMCLRVAQRKAKQRKAHE